MVQWLRQQRRRPFCGPLSGTTRVSRYQKKHSPTHHPHHRPVFIGFFHLLRSIASSLFKLRAWQSGIVAQSTIQTCSYSYCIICAILISRALRLAHVNEESHSFTCHPDVYQCMEWAILPLLPSHRASPHFGRYSFPVHWQCGGRWVILLWSYCPLTWWCTCHCTLLCYTVRHKTVLIIFPLIH